MFYDVNRMMGFNVVAEDGEFGIAKDMLFDDGEFKMRYLVIDTGSWLPGRRVLVSAEAVKRPDWSGQFIPVSLTKDQLAASPVLEKDAPVSRQWEIDAHEHFGWQPYWNRGSADSARKGKLGVADRSSKQATAAMDGGQSEAELRSAHEIVGYRIHAIDGEIGHINDLIIEEEGWVLRYAIVDTHNWLPGRRVLVAVPWIKSIDWKKSRVEVDLTREKIEKSPEWNPGIPLRRPYEELLFDHYKREKYWL